VVVDPAAPLVNVLCTALIGDRPQCLDPHAVCIDTSTFRTLSVSECSYRSRTRLRLRETEAYPELRGTAMSSRPESVVGTIGYCEKSGVLGRVEPSTRTDVSSDARRRGVMGTED
jgi:hypothetical protein